MTFNHFCALCNLTFSKKFILTIHLERAHNVFNENDTLNEEIREYKNQVEEQLFNKICAKGESSTVVEFVLMKCLSIFSFIFLFKL